MLAAHHMFTDSRTHRGSREIQRNTLLFVSSSFVAAVMFCVARRTAVVVEKIHVDLQKLWNVTQVSLQQQQQQFLFQVRIPIVTFLCSFYSFFFHSARNGAWKSCGVLERLLSLLACECRTRNAFYVH